MIIFVHFYFFKIFLYEPIEVWNPKEGYVLRKLYPFQVNLSLQIQLGLGVWSDILSLSLVRPVNQ